MKRYLSHSTEQTEQIAAEFASTLKSGDVIAYRGPMGAGKTAFTRGVAAGLGYQGRVTSPTFTIVNEYEGPLPLFHFDMYRLADEEELFDIGWEDYLSRRGVCLVEWSERIVAALPPDTIRVDITRHPQHDDWRIIRIGGAL